jgi:hypothetical protein
VRGNRIGRHYGGAHWEGSNGSRIVGHVMERAEAPMADAIPWLLLGAKLVGRNGAFSKVTSIQRVNNAGGTAPKAHCSRAAAGKPVRTPYTGPFNFSLCISPLAVTGRGT